MSRFYMSQTHGSRRRRPRFSLVEILCVLAILGILFAVVLGGGGGVQDVSVEATNHLESLGYKVQAVTCATTDSDNDGYISCTARVEGLEHPYGFECSTLGIGCRQPKPVGYSGW